MQEKIKALHTLADTLHANHIDFSLGGSGLLYSLGLVDQVNDWDITLETPLYIVLEALHDFSISSVENGPFPYASDFKIVVTVNHTEIDCINHFSMHSSEGVCNIPFDSTSRWNGINMSSPEAWYIAYALMQQDVKTHMLFDYLATNGAHPTIVKKLLKEPLPDDLVEALLKVPLRI